MRRKLMVAVTLLGLTTAANSASFDPRMTWRTIQTEHFNITFHQGEEQLADEFSRVVERVYDKMEQELQWAPRRRTEVTLVDRTDAANGYASGVPYNSIVIFVTAPEEASVLSQYEDWSEAIFTHEYTHTLHMDTNHGIVRAARAVVGRIASTNDVSPPWMVEGLATFQETRHTEGGRGRTPIADMIKRTAVIEDDFPPLGNLDGIQKAPPSGNLRYLFGQDFVQYVSDHTGEKVWTKWIHTYGSHIPYVLPTKKVFGKRLVPLYFEWKQAMGEHYQAQVTQVEAEGVTESTLISRAAASCANAAFSPDGSTLAFSCYDLREGSSLWFADGDGTNARKEVQDRGATKFTWRADSQAFVYASAHTVNRFNLWSDIYLFDVNSKRSSPLTSGARARDPEFSPDGRELWMVTNRAQNNQLEVLTVDKRREALTNVTDHTQFATPRFSPDGQSVAVSVWQNGRRDLWIYDTRGTPQRRLTMDLANDRDPVWSFDGKWLFFVSDRTGIPNVFAIEVESERLFQVTNVLTGATKPSVHPSFERLAFQQYSADGWDVRVMDLDPQAFIDRGHLPHPHRYATPLRELSQPVSIPPQADAALSWIVDPTYRERRGHGPMAMDGHAQTAEVADNFDMIDVDDVYGDELDYPFEIQPKRYNPLPTLAPRWWLPYFSLSPFRASEPFQLSDAPGSVLNTGLRITAATGSSDTLRHFAWNANASFRTDINFVGGGGSITLNRFIPIYRIFGSVSGAPQTPFTLSDEELDPLPSTLTDGILSKEDYFWSVRQGMGFDISYPYRPRTTVFGRYELYWRTPKFDVPDWADPSAVPIQGRFGKLSAGWRYSWSQPTAFAISREDGRIFSFVTSIMSPYLGSAAVDGTGASVNATQVQISTELREYIVNPFIPNHVLAFRAGVGVSLGSDAFFGNYALGGFYGDGAFYVTPDQSQMLRGYALGAATGDQYWLGSVEYRFPIFRFDRGVGTLPAFFQTLSGAIFCDTGNAFNRVSSAGDVFNDTLVGVGGELSLRGFVGWGGGLDGRLGYGVGLTRGAQPLARVNSLYFRFGGSF